MKLREWLDQEKVTGNEFADRIGLSQGAVSKIVRGAVWPEADSIAAIERETGGKVTASDILAAYQDAQSQREPEGQGVEAQ